MTENELIEHALYFAEKAPVFPCSATKAPLTRNGFKDATQDPGSVREMFAIADARLVGMPTGEISGIAVLDIDMPKNEGAPGGFDWLAANRQHLPTTWTVQTQNNGRHFYFEHYDGLNSSAGKIAPGVDIRADGGYVIVAGEGYEILTKHPPPSFPEAVLSQSHDFKPKEHVAKPAIQSLDFHSPGCWHETLRDWVARMVHRGLKDSEMLEIAPFFRLDGYTLEETIDDVTILIEGARAKGWSGQQAQDFVLKDFEALLELKDPEYLIDGLLVDKSFAMMFGPTGSYKSTVMLDMAICIQNGVSWHGLPTKLRNVAILSHEDGIGLKKRYLAALDLYAVETPQLFWDDCVPDLMNKAEVEAYASELRDKEIGLTVIDTLHYAIPGGEENSATDMGRAIASVQTIREATGGTVLVIHHTGKDANRGARGSSALKAAVDTEISISADEANILVVATKQRHCALGPAKFLRAEVVPVGDSTACVLRDSSAPTLKPTTHGLTGHQLTAWRTLESMFEQRDEVPLADFTSHLKDNKSFTKNQKKADSFTKAFQRCLKAFETAELITISAESLMEYSPARLNDTFSLNLSNVRAR